MCLSSRLIALSAKSKTGISPGLAFSRKRQGPFRLKSLGGLGRLLRRLLGRRLRAAARRAGLLGRRLLRRRLLRGGSLLGGRLLN